MIQHVVGWESLYYDFGVRQPGLLVVRGWRYFTLFAEPHQGVALLEEETELKECKDRPFDENFDYILELNHGVLHANQGLVYRRNPIVTISDKAWDKPGDPDAQNLQPNQLEGLFLLNDDSISQLVRIGFLPPAVQIKDDGTLHVEPPSDFCEVTQVCQEVLKGIGVVISPTEGRSPTDIKGVKNIHFERRYYDDEYNEKIAIVRFRDFRRGRMLVLFDNYVSNMASTSPLDALRIAA
ncbi:hypothetical protein K443DRAFT_9987 [Laccaria amethystina LaAM-08-1]|uniref:Uncharacterized protein n=1 Tax=Laccaria amethystina LaAM-08-1 TaxID=1095629 RepID=A0A0C9WX92_9AGAR|nr:hypothetical protein K443DRAFT_9987 [Laccaria amethystina LaAM-08-1]